MGTVTSSETVVLKGGLTVPLAALQLLWDLESRGCAIRQEAERAPFVGPRNAVTDADAAAIRHYRNELLALVVSCEAIQ